MQKIRVRDLPTTGDGFVDMDGLSRVIEDGDLTLVVERREDITYLRDSARRDVEQRTAASTLGVATKALMADVQQQTLRSESRFWRVFYGVVGIIWLVAIVSLLASGVVRWLGG